MSGTFTIDTSFGDDLAAGGFAEDPLAGFSDGILGGFDESLVGGFNDSFQTGFDGSLGGGFSDSLQGGFSDSLQAGFGGFELDNFETQQFCAAPKENVLIEDFPFEEDTTPVPAGSDNLPVFDNIETFLSDVAVPSIGACPDLVTSSPAVSNTSPAAASISSAVSNPVPRSSVYGSYKGFFKTGDEAKAFRKTSRMGPKPDPMVGVVRATQREYWVERIYESMINTTNVIDGPKSAHLSRFLTAVYDEQELEAAAHKVFDTACDVHEVGWTRPLVQHKKAVRGSRADKAQNSVIARLDELCKLLYKCKATCTDALQGGVTLALLCDNPWLRMGTKETNNCGNGKRVKVYQAGKDVLRTVKDGGIVKTRG